MKKLTFEEIDQLLKYNHVTPYEFGWENFPTDLGPYVIVDKYGGEGKGDEWYRIFHFTDHDIYLKIDAYYSSYSGVDFDGSDGWYEVKPVQRIVTVYE